MQPFKRSIFILVVLMILTPLVVHANSLAIKIKTAKGDFLYGVLKFKREIVQIVEPMENKFY